VAHEANLGSGAESHPGRGPVASTQPPRRFDATTTPDWRPALRPYSWLWLSPVLTVPTLLVIDVGGTLVHELIGGLVWRSNNRSVGEMIPFAAVVLSALWHLILLSWAFDCRVFVRWHARQALAVAGLRTAAALLAVRLVGGALSAFPVLIMIWLVTNVWGRRQVRLGECSLMHWTGQADELEAWRRRYRGHGTGTEVDPDALVDIIRTSIDPQARRRALEQLEELGMVESL
jgi:hypothetical protein